MADISKVKLPNGSVYNVKDEAALPKSGGELTGTVENYKLDGTTKKNTTKIRILPNYSYDNFKDPDDESKDLDGQQSKFFRAVLKQICVDYPSDVGVRYIGSLRPGYAGIADIRIYSNGTKNDSGYPQYANGVFNTIQGTTTVFGFNNYNYYEKNVVIAETGTAIGSSSQPIYVDANGKAQVCTDIEASKLANKLTINTVEYDGSEAVEITIDIDSVSEKVDVVDNDISTLKTRTSELSNTVGQLQTAVSKIDNSSITFSQDGFYWGDNIVEVDNGIVFKHI